jgi:TonB family protein
MEPTQACPVDSTPWAFDSVRCRYAGRPVEAELATAGAYGCTIRLVLARSQVETPLIRCLKEKHTMRAIVTFMAIALGLTITITGCASPPTADVDAAKAALDRAAADGAGQYAAESLKAAQDARAALDAELKAQEGKWFKSYDKTKELAAAAKTAGDKAAADAVAGKEKADAVAAKQQADAAAARAKAKMVPVRPGGRIMEPRKIKDVQPVYPAIAQSARVSGAVVIEATIGSDGKVTDAKVVRSIPLLDQAALDAVRQWEYLPTMLNGVPVPVVVTITINFTR